MIQLFMDESGTHAASPITAVAAYFGTPKVWDSWTRDWQLALAGHGVKTYHAVDCHNRAGEFEGWSTERRDDFVKQMLPIIARHPIGGIAIGINRTALTNAMSQRPELEPLIGNPYAPCFQWVVQTFLDRVQATHHLGIMSESVQIFHEANDFEGDAMKSFEFIVATRPSHAPPMTLEFATKGARTPLQAADILAYETNHALRDPYRAKRKPMQVLNPTGDRLTLLHYGHSNIDKLVTLLSDARRRFMDAGWDGVSLT